MSSIITVEEVDSIDSRRVEEQQPTGRRDRANTVNKLDRGVHEIKL
jgi:hypothetical protein